MAPRELGAKLLGQVPATDPKSLIGRNMEVGVPEITGDNSKYYMKVKVKINKVEGKTCLTCFNGFECAREHLLRMVRKRNRKVENVFDVVTQDGWLLRIKYWAILNGRPPASAENRVRLMSKNFFNEFAKKNILSDIIRRIVSTEIQMRLKKEGSRIYPVRFSEVARIKVLRSPEFKAKPGKEKQEVKAKKEEKPKTEERKAKKKEEKTAERKGQEEKQRQSAKKTAK